MYEQRSNVKPYRNDHLTWDIADILICGSWYEQIMPNRIDALGGGFDLAFYKGAIMADAIDPNDVTILLNLLNAYTSVSAGDITKNIPADKTTLENIGISQDDLDNPIRKIINAWFRTPNNKRLFASGDLVNTATWGDFKTKVLGA
jgi:hypothetical protein